jgi:hypothetical protein
MNKKIVVKKTKNREEYISILSRDDRLTLYSYNIDDDRLGDREVKASFNKAAFIQYIKGAGVPNKYIKEVM